MDRNIEVKPSDSRLLTDEELRRLLPYKDVEIEDRIITIGDSYEGGSIDSEPILKAQRDLTASILRQEIARLREDWRLLVPKDHIVTPKTDYRLLTGMNIE